MYRTLNPATIHSHMYNNKFKTIINSIEKKINSIFRQIYYFQFQLIINWVNIVILKHQSISDFLAKLLNTFIKILINEKNYVLRWI